MNHRVRLCVSALFYFSGLLKLIRWWTQRSGRHLIILYYHRSSGENLRKQWLYLRRHYRILHLQTALEELNASRKKAQGEDRRTLLAITFDDGYGDNYTHAFALSSELQIPISIFLIPAYTNCSHAFWWADRLISHAKIDQISLDGHTYRLDQAEERKALAQCIDSRVSSAASADDRKKFLVPLCEMLEIPAAEIPGEEPAPLLTWAQVAEMEASGWVSFGAHTLHHPDLGRLTDPIEVQREVGECRIVLEQKLGHPVDIFSYPYGRLGDCGLHAVKLSGYKWALTTVAGFNTHESSPHLLHRIHEDVDRHVVVMAAEAAGIWNSFMLLKKFAQLFTRRLLDISTLPGHNPGSQSDRERIIV
jgi:peptidoglycan/xylan/chitin deacetylase (PgdA/CDA1 family)